MFGISEDILVFGWYLMNIDVLDGLIMVVSGLLLGSMICILVMDMLLMCESVCESCCDML